MKCKEQHRCGYFQWRLKRPDVQMTLLRKKDGCDISSDLCQRLNPLIPIEVTASGPQTHREITNAFPLIPNNNGRPERRLAGSGHADIEVFTDLNPPPDP